MGSKRILIVEDNESSRYLLGRFLTNAGHQVIAAANGLEAWAILDRGEMFDRIYSDLDMPKMDGLELLRRIKADSRTAKIDFVLMSGAAVVSVHDSTSLEDATDQLGAYFLAKPLDYDLIIANLM